MEGFPTTSNSVLLQHSQFDTRDVDSAKKETLCHGEKSKTCIPNNFVWDPGWPSPPAVKPAFYLFLIVTVNS